MGRITIRSESPSFGPIGPRRNSKDLVDKGIKRRFNDVTKQLKQGLKATGGKLPSQLRSTPKPKKLFPDIQFHPGSDPRVAWKNFLHWVKKLLTAAKTRILGHNGTYDFWGEPEGQVLVTGYSSFLKGVFGPEDPVFVKELKNSLDNRGLKERIYCDVSCKGLENSEEGCELDCEWDDDEWDDTSSLNSVDSGYESNDTSDTESLSSLESTCEDMGKAVKEQIYVNIHTDPKKHNPANCIRCSFLAQQQRRHKGLNPNKPLEGLLARLCVVYLAQEVNNGDRDLVTALKDLAQILTVE